MSIKTNLPAFAVNCENLSSAKAGAEAVDCSDDFFADKSRLIADSEPEFIEGGMTTMANTWTAGNPVAGELVGMIGALFVSRNQGT